jgi:hypothetical protein
MYPDTGLNWLHEGEQNAETYRVRAQAEQSASLRIAARAAMVTALYRAKRTNRQRTSGPTVGIEDAQPTVAVTRATLGLEGQFLRVL